MTQTTSAAGEPHPKFWTGGLLFAPPILAEVPEEDLLRAFARHQSGDWGDLCDEDIAANEVAIEHGGRLFSAYHDRNGVKFWIITDADRSATTLLLPKAN